MLFIGLYVVGIWEQSQQVSVQLRTPLLSGSETARVQICPKELQVYTATLQVTPELAGLRGFVAFHPVIFGLFSISVIFLLEVAAVLWVIFKRNKSFSLSVDGNYQEKQEEKQLKAIEPIQETQPVVSIPNDFSHLLLIEEIETEKSWFSSNFRPTKEKTA